MARVSYVSNMSRPRIASKFETWARMPANHERLEGLSRGTLYQLIAKGLIVSVSLRELGAERGVRLIGLCSLRTYLARLATEQNART